MMNNTSDRRHEIPNILYKYRPINKLTLDIFTNDEIFSPSPLRFNDPFDCTLSLLRPESRSLIENYITNVTRGTITPEDIKSISENDLHEMMKEANKATLEKHSVYCLSRNSKNTLMWSHYAKNHTGISIGFDITSTHEFHMNSYAIDYRDNYAPINMFKNDPYEIKRLLTTKSMDWSYEEEVRIMFHEPEGRHKIGKEIIKRIIFGCKAAAKDIELVISTCTDNGYDHVTFHQMKKDYGAFSLSEHAINR